jgi:hypothetical protein
MVARLRWRRQPDQVAEAHVEWLDASLRANADAICPDCLRWIGPDEYVRRNVYGLLEHEVCPPASVRARTT